MAFVLFMLQHDTDFSNDLAKLKDYVIPITIKPGETLFDDDDTADSNSGIYFIENGMLVS